jgi:hypothetical protein
MAVQRVAVGSGLTESELINFSGHLTAEEQAHHDDLMRLQYLDGRLEHVAKHCSEILGDANLPVEPGYFLFDHSGNWRPAEGQWGSDTYTSRVWSIARQRGHAPDSPVGFAAQMLDDIDRLNEQRASGNQDGALLTAFFLGVKWSASGIKEKHASKTRTGPRMESRDLAMARAFLEQRPSSRKSDTELKKGIGVQFGLGRSAAIEAVNRGLRNLSA